jgi:hypothetical protein
MVKMYFVRLMLAGFFVLGAVTASFAQAPDTIWTKIYGDNDFERGSSIVNTDDGGFAIVGVTDALFTSGSIQDGDVWLLRLDSMGDTLWTKTYGGSGIDEGNSIHNTFDGGFILAGALSNNFLFYNAWLLRTDSNGDTLWTKSYAKNTEGYATSVIETSDSGFVFTGTVNSQITFSKDVWLVKTDAAGDTVWSKTFGGNGEDIGNVVLQTSDGGFVVAGTKRPIAQERDVYLVRTDENGDTLWTKSYNGPSSINSADEGRDIVLMPDGGFTILGFTSLNIWLLRTDENGDTLWTKQYSGGGKKIHPTSDGGFIITGDLWLTKTDSSGDLMWSRVMDGFAEDVLQTSDGGYVTAGYNFFSATNDDLWIAKFGSGPTSIENTNEKPYDFFLLQNYPNPFNPSTAISYSIPNEKFVSLKIYDIIGNEVSTLVDKKQSAGSYQINFNADGLSSGIYFYKLQTENFNQTMKMILLK